MKKIIRKKLVFPSALYYSSTVIFIVYLVLCLMELVTLFTDKKRLIQIPLVVIVFFLSVALPYSIIEHFRDKKEAYIKKIKFISLFIILFWVLLVSVLSFSLKINFCSRIICWNMLIPIIWFLPNFLIAIVAIIAISRLKLKHK